MITYVTINTRATKARLSRVSFVLFHKEDWLSTIIKRACLVSPKAILITRWLYPLGGVIAICALKDYSTIYVVTLSMIADR